MRKQIFALLLALLLLGSGITAAAILLGENTEDVTYSENRLYGDPAALEGLVLQADYGYRDRAHWFVTHSPSQGEKTQTEHVVYAMSPGYTADTQIPPGVEMGVIGEHYHINSLDELVRLEKNQGNTQLTGLLKAYQELDDATPQGELTNTYIRYADYCEYYPISGRVDTDKGSFQWNPYSTASYLAQGGEAARAFNDYFRIPVLEDDWLQIVIDKRKGSTVESVDVSDPRKGEDYFRMWTVGTCSDGRAYFTFNPRTTGEKLVDTSLIPGGYGLYSFTYDDRGNMDIASLTTLCPLDSSHYPEEIRIEKGKLYYFSGKDMEHWLTVYDLETFEILQQVCILEETEEFWGFYLVREDMLFGVTEEAINIWQKNDSGLYDWQFRVSLPEEDRDDTLYSYYDAFYAFDGQRLAVVNRLRVSREEGSYMRIRELCGYYLSVYGEEGLLYRGEFKSSLEPAVEELWGSRSSGVYSMDVFWEE